MDYGGDDIRLPQKGKRKPYEVDYESLSQSAVEKLMKDDVDYIDSVCGVGVSRDFTHLLYYSRCYIVYTGKHRESAAALHEVE